MRPRRCWRVLVLAAAAAATFGLDLPPGELALPDQEVRDADGRAWRFAADGSLPEEDGDAGGVFGSAASLTVDNQPYVGGAVHLLRLPDDPDPWWEFPVQAANGIEVARLAQLSSRDGVCRWIDLVANPGNAPRSATVRIAHAFLQPPRGVERRGEHGREPACAIHFHPRLRGTVALWWGDCRSSVRVGAGAATYETTIELGPGDLVGVVHALAERADAETAMRAATELDDARLTRGLPWLPGLSIANARGLAGGIAPLRAPGVDTVLLVDGERLRGALIGEALTLAGGERVPLDQLAGCARRGGGAMLVEREDGDARCARLVDASIALALPSGEQATVPAERIAAIARASDRAHPPADAAWEWTGVDGERRRLAGIADPRWTTVLGELALPADELVEIVGCDDGPWTAVLRDGSRLHGLPRDAALAVVGADGATSLPFASLRRLRRVAAPAPDASTGFVATLADGDRLRLALAGPVQLVGVDGAQAIPAERLRALATGADRARVVAHLVDGARVDGRLASPLRARLTWGAEIALPASALGEIVVDLPARERAALRDELRARLAALSAGEPAAREAADWLARHAASLREELTRACDDPALPAATRRRVAVIIGREF